MELILWRHVEAEESDGAIPDLERALTGKGRKQAARMAQWLEARIPQATKIIVSPARRAQQTAQALTDKFKTVDEIAPDAAPEALLKAAGWAEAKGTVLAVGHQPTLGMAAALALTGKPLAWSLKKGALFWIVRREAEGGNALRAALAPDLL